MRIYCFILMLAGLVLSLNGVALAANPIVEELLKEKLPIGGRTIAGPGVGTGVIGERTFIQVGNSLVPKDICTTVVNMGDGTLTLGGKRANTDSSATLVSPGETKALCDYGVISVSLQCNDGTICQYQWRIDLTEFTVN